MRSSSRMFTAIRGTVLALALPALAACGGSDDSGTGPNAAIASIAISPSAGGSIAVGGTMRLTATALDANGGALAGRAMTWSSSDQTIATVSESGLVTALAEGGPVSITATSGQVSGAAPVRVRDLVASITVTPAADASLQTGGTLQLSAELRSGAGRVLTGRGVTWSSSDPGTATVSTSGLVRGIDAGVVSIVASAEDRSSDSVRVTVVGAMTALGPLAKLYASEGFTCGLSAAGAAYCWGSNYGGYLGDGTGRKRLAAGPVVGGHSFTTLALGRVHACGLTATGAAWCWGGSDGWDRYGVLGNGTEDDSPSPVAVAGGRAFSSLYVGDLGTCGLTSGGAAYCWGAYTLTGDGSTTGSLVPAAVAGGHVFTSLHVSWAHSCGLTGSGAAYCWGNNASGALGDGTTERRLVPTAVAGGHVFVTLSLGEGHTCGLTRDGAAYCWGENADSEVGDGTASDRSSPTAVTGGLVFTTLTSRARRTCASTAAGAAYCWGVTARVPTRVDGGVAFASLVLGNGHACGTTTSNSAHCWGFNVDGRLGDGTVTDRASPAIVTGGFAFTSLALGDSHSCGLTTAGLAYCWGLNAVGQLGDGSASNQSSPVAVRLRVTAP